jgi:hypothetical protein
MERLSPELLESLDSQAAIEAEVSTQRNLFPEEPWVPILAAEAPRVARWVRATCAAGHRVAESFVVSARKSAGGTRPVPIVGIAERVIYRALVTFILRNEPPLDRGVVAYQNFVAGPISEAVGDEVLADLDALQNMYVVEADVTSFISTSIMMFSGANSSCGQPKSKPLIASWSSCSSPRDEGMTSRNSWIRQTSSPRSTFKSWSGVSFGAV